MTIVAKSPMRRSGPSLPRQQIRAQHVAGARRQHRQRRKADHRRAQNTVRNARRSDRLEQVLPADRARIDRHDCRDDDGPDEQVHPRVRDLGHDAGEIRVAKEPREQGNRQKR